jgi:ABC-type metal ion transport system substrate-binding protein
LTRVGGLSCRWGKALFESYRNDTVKAFINDTFKGSAIAS